MAANEKLDYATPAELRPGAIAIYNDKRMAAAMLVASLLCFFAGGIAWYYRQVTNLDPVWFFAIAIIALMVGIAGLVNRRPRLIVNDEGVIDSIANYGLIPWSEITGVRATKNRYGPFLCIRLKHPADIQSRVPRVSKFLNPTTPKLDLDEIAIILSSVRTTPEELVAIIEPRLEHGSAS